jgi:ParB-like nuclease domain
MATKTVLRKISDLKITFYVRTQLDEDHVLKLAALIQAGTALPPIIITADNRIIDGRHRLEAHKILDQTEIACEITEETNVVALIGKALGANEGGAKTPTTGDIVHSFLLMLQSGASENKIYAISPYPKAMTRRYLQTAQSTLSKVRIRQAKEAVADGMSVREAAEQFGVDVARLKEAISGKKNMSKANLNSALKTVIRNHNYKATRGVQAVIKRVILGFVDGDITDSQVEECLEYQTEMLTKMVLRLEDWKRRYEAAKRGQMTNWKDADRDEDLAGLDFGGDNAA